MNEMKTKKIICAGHICLDITPIFNPDAVFQTIDDYLVPGKLVNVQGADIHTGGSVANTGLVLKELGCDVELMGKTGDDPFGGVIESILGAYGCRGIIKDKTVATSYSVVLALPGKDRIFIHDPGANDSFVSSDVGSDRLKEAFWFHFGYPPLMKAMYEKDGEELENLFKKAKKAGCITSLDMAAVDPEGECAKCDWDLILKRVLPYVDFFVPSIGELSFMLSNTEKDVVARAKQLAKRCNMYGAGAVMIKCGEKGIYLETSCKKRLGMLQKYIDVPVWSDFSCFHTAFKADVVKSATGAGDAAIGAFIAAVTEGYPPERCLQLAAAEGAMAVTSYDALGGILSLDTLIDRIETGWERGALCL